jgi:thioredoxin 1
VEIVDVALYPSAAKRYGMNIFPSQIFLLPSGKETRHEGFFSRQEIVDKWRELGVNLTPPTSTGQP